MDGYVYLLIHFCLFSITLSFFLSLSLSFFCLITNPWYIIWFSCNKILLYAQQLQSSHSGFNSFFPPAEAGNKVAESSESARMQGRVEWKFSTCSHLTIKNLINIRFGTVAQKTIHVAACKTAPASFWWVIWVMLQPLAPGSFTVIVRSDTAAANEFSQPGYMTLLTK